MITEPFLNACFSLVLNKKANVKKNKSLYRDILSILDFQEKKEKLDIPITIKNKFDCLKKICNMKLEDKSDKSILDSIIYERGKFNVLSDFLCHKAEEDLKEVDVVDFVKQIRLRKKLNSLFSNYDQLSKFLDSIKDGSFDSIDDLVLDYETVIRDLYTNMMEENRGTAIEASASLDMVKDDYTSVVEMIKKKYERQNTTPTGYSILDNNVLRGGFEPSRLYVIGGASGSGKSTLLNNMIMNAATMPKSNPRKPNEDGISDVYLSVTLENTIEESLLRNYQCLFQKSLSQTISDISNGLDIKKALVDKLRENGSTVIIKYFPPFSISSLDLMAELDDVITEYGQEAIRGLYVDYLDLLRTDVKYDHYRLELGHITMSLKTVAVSYNIPVIAPTQLGRSAYRVQDSSQLNLDQVSEAIKKVEHADFVALLSKDSTNDMRVYSKIGKNRSGRSDVNIDFSVNFDHFKFLSGKKSSNSSKADDTAKSKHTDFTGLVTL